MADGQIFWQELEKMSEEDVRRNVLIPLLAKTPGIEAVNDVHGRNEKGLDIIFLEVGAIRRTQYGLQLKKGNISGGGTRTGTVREIVDQLGLAQGLEHSVAVGEIGRVQIEHFIVATTGRISESAREEIASRAGRIPVDFWDGSELVRRIGLYFPELLAAADAATVDYVRALIEHYDKLDALDQVPGIAARKLSDVFQEPQLLRRFDPAAASSVATHSMSALTVLDETPRAVLIADQNEGKTSILRMLLLRNARAILEGQAVPDAAHLPVIVRAIDVVRAGSVEAAIGIQLTKLHGESLLPRLEGDLDAGHYYVAIDGFSELSQAADRAACDAHILGFADRHPKNLIAVAARPEDFLEPTYLTSFAQYVIQDFTDTQVASLVRCWTKGAETPADVARRMVDRVRDALQLPGSPIPAIIGVMLYETEGRYITNTAEAVDRYMVIRLGRYAREMGLKQEVQWEKKEDLLADLAFRMVTEDLDDIAEAEAVAEFDRAFDRLGDDRRSVVALKELLDNGVLVRNGNNLAFHRLAFRDFFAGKRIAQLGGGMAEFFLMNMLDRKWGAALVFAAGLVRHNTDLLHKLCGRVGDLATLPLEIVGENDHLYAGYFVGKVLSNSDAAHEPARIAALKVCLSAARDSIDPFAEEAKREFGNIGEIAALLGVEQSFFLTVGVPWLSKQLRTLAADQEISEEERFFAASAYAQLHSPDWLGVVESFAQEFQKTRVGLSIHALLLRIEAERPLLKNELRRLRQVTTEVVKKNRRRQFEVDELLKVRSKVLEIEISRMRRLTSGK